MNIYDLKKEDYERWNSFVDQSPQGSLYSKTWYLESLDAPFRIIAVENKGRIEAGIVLSQNEIKTYSNPLLTKYLGVLLKHEEGNAFKSGSQNYKLQELLIDELVKIKSFDYTFHPNYNNWLPFFWNGFAQSTNYSYRLRLKGKSEEELFSAFEKSLRYEIRKAEEGGYKTVENIDFDSFFSVIGKTYEKQNAKTPFKAAKIKNYIERLEARNAGFRLGVQNADGKLISVAFVVYDAGCGYFVLNGTDYTIEQTGANQYLLCQCIVKCIKTSDYFDFEGSMIKGIESFYRKFGGELTPYLRIWQNNLLNFAKQLMIKKYKKMFYGK